MVIKRNKPVSRVYKETLYWQLSKASIFHYLYNIYYLYNISIIYIPLGESISALLHRYGSIFNCKKTSKQGLDGILSDPPITTATESERDPEESIK